MSTKAKGDLLEMVIERLCQGAVGVSVTRNAKVVGINSKDKRDIDVLILGSIGPFSVKIVIEAKNYNKPVGVEKVESLVAKLRDVCATHGVMVCALGFTKPALNLARANGIVLMQAFDQVLGNCNLLIPLRYIEPQLKGYSVGLYRLGGSFSIAADESCWLFWIDGNRLDVSSLALHAWNCGKVPQTPGCHTVDYGAMKISDTTRPDHPQYCDVKVFITVTEKYFLKLFPATYLKNLDDDTQHFKMGVDLWSQESDMLSHGWIMYGSFDEMNTAADIANQPKEVRNLIMRAGYRFSDVPLNH